MSGSGTFVYLLEEDAVLAILPDWPAGMQVAVCLSSGGACDLAVHHRDEVARVLERITQLHGWSSDELCVAPQVEGYPTRKVLFSEEQQLLSVVADSPHLVELASDYALNYRFAQDEGLDADAVTGASAAQVSKAENTPPEEPQPLQDAATRKTMSTRSKAFITHLSLPAGYASSASAQRPECAFVDAHLLRKDGYVRIVIDPDQPTGAQAPVTVKRIGCRDDFARFVLPRSVLDGWTKGQTCILEMSEDLFPEAVVERFMHEPYLCAVTVTVRGVFVTPTEPVAAQSKGTEAAPPVNASHSRGRIFRSVHVAVAALVAVMVVTGHFAAALDRSDVQGTIAHGAGDGATAALDLIAALAGDDVAD